MPSRAGNFHDRYVTVPESGCWLWEMYITRDGYGTIRNGPNIVLAHRMSWEIHFGSIPDGLCVCHKCDTPSCVNPEHLFLGSHETNMKDMKFKGRASKKPKIKGAQCWKTSLSDSQVVEIFLDKRSQREIAACYGITQSSVSLIKTGKNWAHVTSKAEVQNAK